MASRTTPQSEEYSRLNGQLWLYTTALRNWHTGVNMDKKTGELGFTQTESVRRKYVMERNILLKRIRYFDAAYGIGENEI